MIPINNPTLPALAKQTLIPISPSPKPITLPRLSCPVCTASHGIIELPISLIQAIAAAVYEPLEWAIVLRGERYSTNHVRVTSWVFPPQTRRQSTVDIDDLALTPDTIGVVHSHHAMGAFFSGVDIRELNPYYPTSIVVAQYKPPTPPKVPAQETEKDFTQRIFGWSYQALGTVNLPCGSIFP